MVLQERPISSASALVLEVGSSGSSSICTRESESIFSSRKVSLIGIRIQLILVIGSRLGAGGELTAHSADYSEPPMKVREPESAHGFSRSKGSKKWWE